MHELLREQSHDVLGRYHAVAVGRLPATSDSAHVLRYVSESDHYSNMVFNMVFQYGIVDLGQDALYNLNLEEYPLLDFQGIVDRWQRSVIENPLIPL